LGTNNTDNTFAALHVKHYQNFGPPPRNYYAARYDHEMQGVMMFYADHSVDDSVKTKANGGSWDHPCSPAGLKAIPPPTFLPEFVVNRQSSPGFFRPPMDYVPGQVLWKHHASWEAALAAALTQNGVQTTGGPMTAADIKSNLDNLAKGAQYKEMQSHVLYHPADRNTAIFKGEVEASLVARWGGAPVCFSLIIVCPLVRADGTDWDRIWDTHNRPPVVTSWSTGAQAVYEPLVLMCLPKPETTQGRESYHKETAWFCMEPAPDSAFQKSWIQQYGAHLHACGMFL
jgi:hypothetical protein